MASFFYYYHNILHQFSIKYTTSLLLISSGSLIPATEYLLIKVKYYMFGNSHASHMFYCLPKVNGSFNPGLFVLSGFISGDFIWSNVNYNEIGGSYGC